MDSHYSKWKSIEEYYGPLSVACRLDPMSKLPYDLSLYLKLQTLFWDKLIIPETFLLNNPTFFNALKVGSTRREIYDFFNEAQPIVTRNDHEWNESFEAHWEQSLKTQNPLHIDGKAGIQHARFLDQLVSDNQCRYYTSVKRARSFPDLFNESLTTILDGKHIHPAGQTTLRKFLQARVQASETNSIRNEVDGFPGLSRGRVYEALSALAIDPHLMSFLPDVEEAARQAYAMNILNSLNRETTNSAIVPLLVNSQLGLANDYQLVLDEDVVNKLSKNFSGLGKLYNIDRESIRDTSWKDIVTLSQNPHRMKFNQFRSKIPNSNNNDAGKCVLKMLESLDLYLMDISGFLCGRESLRVGLRKYIKPDVIAKDFLIGYLIGLAFKEPGLGAFVSTTFSTAKSVTQLAVAEFKDRHRIRRLNDYILSKK